MSDGAESCGEYGKNWKDKRKTVRESVNPCDILKISIKSLRVTRNGVMRYFSLRKAFMKIIKFNLKLCHAWITFEMKHSHYIQKPYRSKVTICYQ